MKMFLSNHQTNNLNPVFPGQPPHEFPSANPSMMPKSISIQNQYQSNVSIQYRTSRCNTLSKLMHCIYWSNYYFIFYSFIGLQHCTCWSIYYFIHCYFQYFCSASNREYSTPSADIGSSVEYCGCFAASAISHKTLSTTVGQGYCAMSNGTSDAQSTNVSAP